MNLDEIQDLANRQREDFYCHVPTDERAKRKWSLQEAEILANFNAAHLPLEKQNLDEFFSEWVDRLVQAAKILREANLIEFLDLPTKNANETFGVEVLKAAAHGDRSGCQELLRLGISDPENQGIYSDGIRRSVWEFLRNSACPPVDGVAAAFPLLASIGPRPDWLPMNWKIAAWPLHPDRDSTLELVKWLILCEQVWESPPARQEALQQIGHYAKEMRSVRDLLFLLHSQGEGDFRIPETPDDLSQGMMVERLNTLQWDLQARQRKQTEELASGTEEGLANETKPYLQLLKALTGGVANEKFHQSAEVIANDEKSCNERLFEIHRLTPISNSVSAEKLANAMGVTSTAIKKTDWWKKNRSGTRDRRINDRQERHKHRAKELDRSGFDDDDE